MKKQYNAPIFSPFNPLGPGTDETTTGTGSGMGDNFMTWSDWLDHHPEGTKAEYEDYCSSFPVPFDPIWD